MLQVSPGMTEQQQQQQHRGKIKTRLNLETRGSVGTHWDDSSRERRVGLERRIKKVADAHKIQH